MKKTVIRLVLAIMVLTLTVALAACTKDDPIKDSETTPADTTLHTHTYKETVVAPTCTEAGYTIHLCEECGDSYHDNATPMVAHSFGDWKVTLAASCTAEGAQARTCSVCGAEETAKVEKTEHRYDSVVVAPEKTTGGYTVHTCKYCKDSKTDSYTNATGSVGLEYAENADKTLTIVGVGSCEGEHLENLIIYSTNAEGKTVTAIAPGAFAGNNKIKSVALPASLTNLGAGAFAGCSKLETVTVETGNKTYSSPDKSNVVYSADGKTIVLFPAGNALTTFTIGKDITDIAPGAFAGCENITEFKLEDTGRINKIFRIENDVLYMLDELEDKDDTTQDIVRLIAFPAGKTDVTVFNVPTTVTTIDAFAFYGNEKLTDIVIPVRTYDADAEVKILTNTIGAFAFASCPKLESVDLGNATSVIGESLFANCTKLEEVTLSERITVLPKYTFLNCKALKTVILPDANEAVEADGLVTVSENAFKNCTALKTVVVGDAVRTIERNAFENCTAFVEAFFKGTSTDWARIESGIHTSNVTFYRDYLYYYSETAPSGIIVKMWHYVAGVPTAY